MWRLCAILGLAGAAAHAAPSCKNISATALTFTNYDVYAGAPNDVSGTISYSCPPPISPTVTIDAGLHASGGQRHMLLLTGTDLLAYDVFVDSTYTVIWGSTPVAVAAGNAATVRFYGRAYALQDVGVGNYADTLTVTFNF